MLLSSRMLLIVYLLPRGLRADKGGIGLLPTP
jgi:hypothetical protein